MKLSPEQLQAYHKTGYLVLDDYFSAEEVTYLKEELVPLFASEGPERVLEKDGETVRAVHGSHLFNDVYARLVRLEKLLIPAEQILESEVYVHQFKINAKAGMVGDVWEWHQDYTFWLVEDGMMEPRALNIAIFLDEVTEFNGPLLLIPQSHHDGALDIATDTDVPEDYAKHGKWITTLTAKLKHTLSKESLKELVTKYGIVAPKGSSGSVLFFHPSVVHGSVPNLSPFDRTLLVISYNSVENPLKDVSEPRPEFLASRDFTPLEAIPDEALQST